MLPETNWEQKREDIEKLDIDIFGMGSDWQGKFDDLSNQCKVVYLDRTGNISTTEIKSNLGANQGRS